MRAYLRSSEEVEELLDRHVGLPEDGAQSTAVELPVIRNDDLGERIVPPQYEVAAVLALEDEARPTERLDAVAPGELGQLAQTATSRASRESTGTVSPSSSRLRVYASMASRTFSIASSRLAP